MATIGRSDNAAFAFSGHTPLRTPMNETPPAGPPWREADRLAALDSYAIMDTAREGEFDDIVRVAALVCGVPMALISLVDHERQWFKAAVGIAAPQTPRDIAFCAHAIQQDGQFTVEDASSDDRFSANPLVTGELSLRFYTGAPLRTPEGLPLGTLCVLDDRPRTLSADQTFALDALARQVMAQLELRKALATRALMTDELNHRVKNTLAIAQAIVAQSLKTSGSLAEAGRIIEDRLVSLGRTHDILTDGDWRAAPVAAVVDAAVRVHAGHTGQIRAEGQSVSLNPQATVALSMALHELATNAAKYGALGAAQGSVSIAWRLTQADDGPTMFELTWTESGGPPVSPPTRRGFGSRLIGNPLVSVGGAASRIDYAPGGVVWRTTAPVADIAAE